MTSKELLLNAARLLGASRYQEAVEMYTTVIRMAEDPDSTFYAYYNRGITHAKMGDYEKALIDFDWAISLNRDDPEVFFNRGSLYALLENYIQAIRDYDRSIELNPRDPQVYHGRARAKIMLGRYDEAHEDMRVSAEMGHEEAKRYLLNLENVKWKMEKA